MSVANNRQGLQRNRSGSMGSVMETRVKRAEREPRQHKDQSGNKGAGDRDAEGRGWREALGRQGAGRAKERGQGHGEGEQARERHQHQESGAVRQRGPQLHGEEGAWGREGAGDRALPQHAQWGKGLIGGSSLQGEKVSLR